MEVLFFLVPVSISIAGCALCAFIWAARNGQFDDLDTPPKRVIFETDPRKEKVNS